MTELTIVMPVYNEGKVIAQVLEQWSETLRSLEIDYKIVVYNDGSKDESYSVISKVAQLNPRISVINKPNSGHGPSILKGYWDNLDSSWLFQIDSDGELGPEHFSTIWDKREDYDFLIGNRINRVSPLPRKITTWISRLLVWLFYGRSVFDVNCPYRLFRPYILKEQLLKIPTDTLAPNLIISGLVSQLGLRVYQTDVVHTERQTGEVSIKKWNLFKFAVISCGQTIEYRWRI